VRVIFRGKRAALHAYSTKLSLNVVLLFLGLCVPLFEVNESHMQRLVQRGSGTNHDFTYWVVADIRSERDGSPEVETQEARLAAKLATRKSNIPGN